MVFSVIVITQDNYYEQIVVTRTGLSTGSDPIYYLNSSKFDFSQNINTYPIMTHYFQWITGSSNYYYSTTNYFSYARLFAMNPSSSSSNS